MMLKTYIVHVQSVTGGGHNVDEHNVKDDNNERRKESDSMHHFDVVFAGRHEIRGIAFKVERSNYLHHCKKMHK